MESAKMNQEYFDMVSEFNKQAIEATKRLGDFNQRTIETFLGKQTEVANVCYEAGIKNFKLFSQVKDPKELISLQSDLVRDCSERFVKSLRENSDMVVAARDEFTKLVEENAHVVGDTLKKASTATIQK